jgi:hypothetical protein
MKTVNLTGFGALPCDAGQGSGEIVEGLLCLCLEIAPHYLASRVQRRMTSDEVNRLAFTSTT